MWAKLSRPGGLKLGAKSPRILPSRAIQSISYENKGMDIPKKIITRWGDTIDFRSSDSGREKFEGAEYDLVWIDEEMADPLIYQEIERGLVDRGGRLIWTATPLARSVTLLELHEASQEEAGDVYEVQLSIYDNPYLDVKARDAFIANLPEDYRPTRVFGEFLILEGLVYGEWNRAIHEVSRQQFEREFDPHNPRVVIIDPGYAHPCAVLWGMLLPGYPRRVVFYREYVKRRQTVNEVVREIARVSEGEPLIAAYIDPDSLKTNQSGSQSLYRLYLQAFKDAGLKNAITGSPLSLRLADNNIEPGIYKVKEFLKPGQDGIPGIQAVEDLANLKRELARYRWATETATKDVPHKPVDKNNHLLDDMRYAIMGLPPYVCQQDEQMAASERVYNEAQRVMQADKKSYITIGGS